MKRPGQLKCLATAAQLYTTTGADDRALDEQKQAQVDQKCRGKNRASHGGPQPKCGEGVALDWWKGCTVQENHRCKVVGCVKCLGEDECIMRHETGCMILGQGWNGDRNDLVTLGEKKAGIPRPEAGI
jgi:hypothetical protein